MGYSFKLLLPATLYSSPSIPKKICVPSEIQLMHLVTFATVEATTSKHELLLKRFIEQSLQMTAF